MGPTQSDYHSYLLRVWQVHGEAGAGWRASLEDVQSGDLHGFEDLAALQRFLEELATEEPVEAAVLDQQLE